MARATVPPNSSSSQPRPRRGRGAAVPDDPILCLPFVRDLPKRKPNGDRRTFWAPDADDLDYVSACALGHDFAIEAIQYMRAKKTSSLLNWVVFDMFPGQCEKTNDGAKGVMVGFLSTIAGLAIAGATPEHLLECERCHAEWQAFWSRLTAGKGKRVRRPAGGGA
jgi:hypothetical protein